MTQRPLADYALLSDCNTAALVSRDGSIDWLCVPQFDSPAVFGRLLDDQAGHWSLRPADRFDVTRRYRADSLVLHTDVETASGRATMTDALLFGADEQGHGIGTSVPHVLARTVEVVDGTMAFTSEFAPRPEYGIVTPHVRSVAGGMMTSGGAARLVLSCPKPTSIDAATVVWRMALVPGEVAAVAMQYVPTGQPIPDTLTRGEICERLEETDAAWRSWSGLHQRYDGPWRDAVRHSGRVLQGLTYRPTGAIVAAPTTSLPETPGGGRNWDYRFAWLRDASMAMQALWVAACPDEAGQLLSFLMDAAGTSPEHPEGVHIMYGIGGEHDLAERELSHLDGWRCSQPVRIGNAAWEQTQHDTYGVLLDAVHCYRDQLDGLDPSMKQFVIALVDHAATIWNEPDQGIWEIRGAARHHLHSTLMCWVALDRGIRLADRLGAGSRVDDWHVVAAQIRKRILNEGWNDELGAYTQTLGGDDLDAAVLLMAITGFLPAHDPRMRSTIDAVATHLAAPNGLLYRYVGDDGLDGDEAPFLICSFWLAECWALAGELDKARATFEGAAGHANDVGLLSEEADDDGLLGNFPQSFSHIGLINAAAAIARAETEASSSPRCVPPES